MKRSEEEFRRLAQYDTLTGLPNRYMFNQRFAHALTRDALYDEVWTPLYAGSAANTEAANTMYVYAAGQAGLDPFDGYLAGLLHNSGWTAVLRAIDNLEDLAIGVTDISRCSSSRACRPTA